jgi:hypothetical protein
VALTATVAVAVALWCGALASGGIAVAGRTVDPLLYGLLLVPAVAAVASGRRPAAVPLPAGLVRAAQVVGLFLALYLFAGRGRPAGVTGLAGAMAFAAVALSWWWPRPGSLRLSLAFGIVALLGPGPGSDGRGAALVVLAGAVAVALVATSGLAASAAPPLGGRLPPVRTRRVATEVGGVAALLALAALVAAIYQPPSQEMSDPRPGAAPALDERPAPLGFEEGLDPVRAGGGRGGDEVVLRVSARRASTWRAQVFERWDGRRWVGLGPDPDRLRTGRPLFLGLDFFESVPSGHLEQEIRVETSYAEVAVGAPKAYVFELPGQGEAWLDGTVRFSPPLGRGATYEVTSVIHPASPDQLRAADPDPSMAGAERLAVPGLSARSRAFATRVTAAATSAYDKVTALEAALARRVRVDDDVAPLPPGADVVDRVLFVDRAGSPTRLATTLALLARAVGVPARVATGFLAGHRPLLGGDFVVRAGDAHVWVEVPFPGYGWQRFDATGRIPAAERDDSFWSRLRRFLARWWPVVVAMAVLVSGLVVRWAVRRHRRYRALPWATRYQARLDRAGAKRGRPRGPAETPAEYAAALADGPLADERLHLVGRLVTEAAWSGREPSDEARQWAEQVLEQSSARRSTPR